MICPECGYTKSRVVNSRMDEWGANRRNRQYKCPKCKKVFHTSEEIIKKS